MLRSAPWWMKNRKTLPFPSLSKRTMCPSSLRLIGIGEIVIRNRKIVFRIWIPWSEGETRAEDGDGGQGIARGRCGKFPAAVFLPPLQKDTRRTASRLAARGFLLLFYHLDLVVFRSR